MNTPYHLPHLDDFLLHLQTNNYSEKTIYNYERDLETFQVFLQETKTPFRDISKNTINLYKAELISIDRKTLRNGKNASKKLKSASVNRLLSSIRAYLKYLIDADIPSPISPEAIRLVKNEKKHPQISELDTLITLIESPSTIEGNKTVALRNRAMMEVLFSTGMRISELVSLNKNQIDNSGKIFITGKGRKERFVYLTPRAFDHLKNYLDKCSSDDSPALFVPLRGSRTKKNQSSDKRISTNYLQERIKYYRERLKINVPTSAHSLRHGFATYLAEKGANPAAIQILLGHESLETTTRYVNPSDRYAEKTHKKFHPLKEDKSK